MTPLVKIAVVLISAFVTLEGLLVFLWPGRIKQMLAESSPRGLRIVALLEFLFGLAVFGYLIFHI